MTILKRFSLILALIFFCNYLRAQKSIENYKSEILSEDEMLITTGKALKLIQENKPLDLKNLFTEDIRKNITDSQIKQLTEQLNSFFKTETIPTDKRDILPSLQASVNNNNTIFINNINYNFKSSQTLIFSFLKKYGTKELSGISLQNKPLNSKNYRPSIKQIENFNFNIDDVTHFRIYYDEGKNKHTKFKNEIGYFAIQGDSEEFEKSKIKPIIKNIFSELTKSKYESVDVFNNSLQRGENPKFIQIEVALKDKPYLLFLYLPLLQDQKYSGKIVLMEKEYQNLGYQFILNQNDYLNIVKEFPKILDLKLDNFYEEKP
ncbi:hypothetical protein [Chryseobacterium limigenitum]|uniref:Uncharacterized protein n=1 Tax=Chryseobacterium limigenitum TaxID=1612149 RepID=A0A1K2IQN5_9FLAO|nr:hypothetical protein [Chryseobacterium limigenitum]SFZ94630.1 hypothetical protein SAMN05216324_107106 [Chryseobacterium limigenitum]